VSKAEDAKLCALCREGASYARLQRELRRGHKWIRARRQALGLLPTPRDLDAVLRALVGLGFGIEEIRAEMGVRRSTLHARAKALGLTLRDKRRCPADALPRATPWPVAARIFTVSNPS